MKVNSLIFFGIFFLTSTFNLMPALQENQQIEEQIANLLNSSELNKKILELSQDSQCQIKIKLIEKLFCADFMCQAISDQNGAISAASYDSITNLILIGYNDGSVCIWDISRSCAELIHNYDSEILDVAFDGAYAIVSTLESGTHLFKFGQSLTEKEELIGHTSRVKAVAINQNANLGVTASYDHTIRLWKLNSDDLQSTVLTGHQCAIASIALSADNNFLLSGSLDRTARLWNLKDSPISHKILRQDTSSVMAVALNAKFNIALTGSNDGIVRLWDLSSEDLHCSNLNGHTQPVRAVAISRNGNYALSGSSDGIVRLWDLTTTEFNSVVIANTGSAITRVSFSSDSQFAFIASNIIKLIDLGLLHNDISQLIASLRSQQYHETVN